MKELSLYQYFHLITSLNFSLNLACSAAIFFVVARINSYCVSPHRLAEQKFQKVSLSLSIRNFTSECGLKNGNHSVNKLKPALNIVVSNGDVPASTGT